jgi:DNA polymerase III epsilon subunit-like protein
MPMFVAIASVVTKQAPAKRVSFKANDMVRLPRYGLGARLRGGPAATAMVGGRPLSPNLGCPPCPRRRDCWFRDVNRRIGAAIKQTIREIVLDTETTGLDPLDGYRVVEIEAAELIDHRVDVSSLRQRRRWHTVAAE